MSGSLFPGWRPGAAGRERLQDLVARLGAARPAHAPALRLRRPDQWHATLCFIGRGAAPLASPALLDALADVAAGAAPCGFDVARLDYLSGPGVLVALPRDPAPLQSLCDAVHAAVLGCGIAGAQATTRPHVTLAHLDRGLPAQAWLAGVDCAGATMEVDGFELLFNPGGRYDALGQWPLNGAARSRA